MIEISVKVSNAEMKLTEKFLLHEEGLIISHDHLPLKQMVEETIRKFKDEAEDVLVTFKFVW
jgi:hypothetical protein